MKITKKLFAISLIVVLMSAVAVSVASAAPQALTEEPPPDFPGLAIMIGGLSVGATIIFPLTQLLKTFKVPDGVGGIIAIVLAAITAGLVQAAMNVPSIGAALPGIVEGVATLLDLLLKFVALVTGALGGFKVGRAMLPGRV